MADAVVDSCCLINLYAAGDLTALLPALGLKLHVPTKVQEESLFIRRVTEEGAVLERIDLTPAIQTSLLHACPISGEGETELYVQLAVDLDDGEAMCLAIAKTRSWLLATDDRKASRLGTELGVQMITTPELIKRWADSTSAAKADVATILRNIQKSANFVPRVKSPLHAWWWDHVSD